MKNLLILKEKDCKDFFKKIIEKDGIFICTIATTETAQIPGISAAGATPELRKYTAQADVEYLYYGKPFTIREIPKNPLGPPSPVIITKAGIDLMGLPIFIIDAGCEIKPYVPSIVLRERGLKCITTGQAFKDGGVELIKKSEVLAKEFLKFDRFVILGESVPGGTTTALSLLSFLGINAFGKVSSSMSDNAHNLKEDVVIRAHKNSKLSKEMILKNPVKIVESIGDSMQLVNAILTIYLSKKVPVILAGGTQMLAVTAFIEVLEKYIGVKANWDNIAVATTRWVACDNKADFVGLAREMGKLKYVFACDLNFSESKMEGLRGYEKGLVKEGVGAGGVITVGFIKKCFSHKKILNEIERLFEKMSK
ncbi:MAG: TIGR00303 family protein [Proteobacteria bacterium]|nr:TIGR00303 family protein [Pseudomonadota bacterium]